MIGEDRKSGANTVDSKLPAKTTDQADNTPATNDRPKEIGGRAGPDPTRFGDWEKNGRCIDF
jgi:hypothetical protein